MVLLKLLHRRVPPVQRVGNPKRILSNVHSVVASTGLTSRASTRGSAAFCIRAQEVGEFEGVVAVAVAAVLSATVLKAFS